MTDDLKTRRYEKRRYACRVRVRRSRLNAWREGVHGLKERRRLAEVLTRWIRRRLRDQPVVVGTARLEVVDWWRKRPALIATASCFTNVPAEDRAVLSQLVDRPDCRTVEIPEPVDVVASLR